MSQFVFELEPLLKVRKVEEDRRVRVLREIEVELSEIRSSIVRVTEDRSRELDQLGKASQGEIDVSLLAARRRRVNQLELDERKLRRDLEPVLERCATARLELTKAIDERRAVERLREKRKREYLVERARQEIRRIDETGRAAALARERIET